MLKTVHAESGTQISTALLAYRCRDIHGAQRQRRVDQRSLPDTRPWHIRLHWRRELKSVVRTMLGRRTLGTSCPMLLAPATRIIRPTCTADPLDQRVWLVISRLLSQKAQQSRNIRRDPPRLCRMYAGRGSITYGENDGEPGEVFSRISSNPPS